MDKFGGKNLTITRKRKSRNRIPNPLGNEIGNSIIEKKKVHYIHIKIIQKTLLTTFLTVLKTPV